MRILTKLLLQDELSVADFNIFIDLIFQLFYNCIGVPSTSQLYLAYEKAGRTDTDSS